MISTMIDPRRLRIAPPMDLNSEPKAGLISGLPLRLQTKNGDGLFGAGRPIMGREEGLIRLHEGVDLDAPEDEPVFSVERGTVVRVARISDDADNMVIAIHHDPSGLGFVSRYLHVKNPVVANGDSVEAGQLIAAVGPRPTPHLHFETRQLFTSNGTGLGNREASLPLDPTMALYQLEVKLSTGAHEHDADLAVISRIGEDFRKRMRFIVVELDGNPEQFFVPVYEPLAPDLSMIATLKEAFFRRRPVRIRWRDSLFLADIQAGDYAKMILEVHVVPAASKYGAPRQGSSWHANFLDTAGPEL
jgi:hypothetical protein